MGLNDLFKIVNLNFKKNYEQILINVLDHYTSENIECRYYVWY